MNKKDKPATYLPGWTPVEHRKAKMNKQQVSAIVVAEAIAFALGFVLGAILF